MTKAIYRLAVDYGRMGYVEGLFIAEKADVLKIAGKTVHFGEILGKHSEVSVDINDESLTVLSEDQDFIAKFEEIMGEGTISGYNPLHFYEADEEEQAA